MSTPVPALRRVFVIITIMDTSTGAASSSWHNVTIPQGMRNEDLLEQTLTHVTGRPPEHRRNIGVMYYAVLPEEVAA